MTGNLEKKSLLGGLSFHKGGFFDLRHPLVNWIAESFVKTAAIGAVQALAKEVCLKAFEGIGSSKPSKSTDDITGVKNKKQGLPGLKGETNQRSLEAMVKNTGKESLQWGLAAGLYSGLTYGLKEARGSHDWKNSAVAGAITGMAVALTCENTTHEQVVQCAITGAALSTAASLLDF